MDIQAVGLGKTFKLKERDTKGIETEAVEGLLKAVGKGLTTILKHLADGVGPRTERHEWQNPPFSLTSKR